MCDEKRPHTTEREGLVATLIWKGPCRRKMTAGPSMFVRVKGQGVLVRCN